MLRSVHAMVMSLCHAINVSFSALTSSEVDEEIRPHLVEILPPSYSYVYETLKSDDVHGGFEATFRVGGVKSREDAKVRLTHV